MFMHCSGTYNLLNGACPSVNELAIFLLDIGQFDMALSPLMEQLQFFDGAETVLETLHKNDSSDNSLLFGGRAANPTTVLVNH